MSDMRNISKYIFFIGIALLAIPGAYAQEAIPGGFRHQGVVRDPSGRPLSNTPVTVQILLSEDAIMGKALYIETHEVVTGATGEFSIIVGEGHPAKDPFESISWSRDNLWLHVTLQSRSGRRMVKVLSSTRLPVVPYAMHALTTSRITGVSEGDAEALEKQQSIFWLTGGNSLTKPGTHFLGTRDSVDLIFKTNGQSRMTITGQGQVKYEAGATMTGEDKFPVHIKGAMQGIHIKANGSRDSSSVFVDFGDTENASWGRIIGQTFAEWKKNELEASWRYSSDAYDFKLAELSASVAGMVLMVAGAYKTGIGVPEGIALTLDMAAVVAELAFFIKAYEQFVTNGATYQGVTYSSGAADYAEYLERVPGHRKLEPGEVVGVKNGQVSLVTEGADHLLAVSSAPIALGNLPKEHEKERFEKIAFMGQVPVRVIGAVNIGDYILPSGNNDGLSIAVAPDKMRAADYSNILGVAWSNSNPEGPADFQRINVAIGINAFELSSELVRLEQQVRAIKAFLKGESPDFRTQGRDDQLITRSMPLNSPSSDKQNLSGLKLSAEEYARVLDENESLIAQIFRKANEGLPDDVRNHPRVIALMEAPLPSLKEMYRDARGYLARLEQEASKVQGK